MNILRQSRKRVLSRRVLVIAGLWTIVGGLDALNTMVIADSDFVKGIPSFDWRYFLTIKLLTAFIAGLISGGILVFFLRERFRNETFGAALLTNSTIISIINFGILALFYHFFLDIDYTETTFLIKSLLFWTIITVLTIIFLHVNEKYGQGIFIKLLVGLYHHPREEERIFMFVDLKSSTAIAEDLGHIRFFNLLNDFFIDITNPILYTRGEIYQYVGDEIVISWSMKNGLKQGNCIRCFYGMMEVINRAADRYRERYQLVPEFKAGLHAGVVTTGEIGIIKRDIVYSGDVLNTTARIESLCNLYGTRMLISKHLINLLQLPPNQYLIERMGNIELRGKKKRVELFTFSDCKYSHSAEDSIYST